MSTTPPNANDPAFPRAGFYSPRDQGRPVANAPQAGLTKRELIAVEMHKAMLSNASIARSVNMDDNVINHYSEEDFARNCAQLAIMHAEVLLEELERTAQTGENPMRKVRMRA